MNKFLISVICVLVLQSSVLAQSQASKTLSTIENNLYGIEYSNQNDSERLDRIEQTVYGEKKSGSVKSRLSALDKDIASEQMGKEVTPRKYAFTNGEDDGDNFYSPKTQQGQQLAQQQEEYIEPEEKADPNIEYPVVDSLEQTAFGKSYKQMEIKTRISNLEKHAFRKTYTNDDLATRVDRLKDKLAYNAPKHSDEAFFAHDDYYQDESYLADNAQTQYPDNYFSPQNVQQESFNNSVNPEKAWDRQISDRDFRSKLNKLEKNVYKQSFSNDTVDKRLSRLESTVFNANFSKESDSSRLSRLYGAVNAQKVAKKYDSNGFQQKMATALQIGFMVLMVVAMIL